MLQEAGDAVGRWLQLSAAVGRSCTAAIKCELLHLTLLGVADSGWLDVTKVIMFVVVVLWLV